MAAEDLTPRWQNLASRYRACRHQHEQHHQKPAWQHEVDCKHGTVRGFINLPPEAMPCCAACEAIIMAAGE